MTSGEQVGFIWNSITFQVTPDLETPSCPFASAPWTLLAAPCCWHCHWGLACCRRRGRRAADARRATPATNSRPTSTVVVTATALRTSAEDLTQPAEVLAG